MDRRLTYAKAAPEPFAAMLRLTRTLHAGGVPTLMRALVELRVSQLNGCAFCCDMHAREARSAGATARQLDCLAAWHEADFFDAATRAALAWAEAVTLIRETRAPREVYEQALQQFGERQLAELTFIVTTIDAWNRLGIAFRVAPARAGAAAGTP